MLLLLTLFLFNLLLQRMIHLNTLLNNNLYILTQALIVINVITCIFMNKNTFDEISTFDNPKSLWFLNLEMRRGG